MSKTSEAAIKRDNEIEENMAIWNRVCQTNVDHTKEVSFGRKFTAIDAHSQIMEATRTFGPIGEGWGYDNEYGEIHLTDGRVIAWCDVRFWWSAMGEWEGNKSRNPKKHFGPVRGAAMLIGFDKGGKLKAPDTDAFKKASTDGLTKLISHLGFNADVFLGMFDDNKYVTGLKKEAEKIQTASAAAYAEDRAKFIKLVTDCKKASDIDKVLENSNLWIAGLDAGTQAELRSWCMQKKTELK